METNTNTPEAKQPPSAGCHPTTCSPSDTPETDAVWARHKNSRDPAKIEAALLDHAEKTERHRNAAIKCLRHCRLFFDGKGYHPDEATERELIKMELDAILAENVRALAPASEGKEIES